MKLNKLQTIGIILAVTITASLAIIGMTAKETRGNDSKNTDNSSQINTVDTETSQEQSNTINDVAAIIYNEIPEEYFGGMYINDKGNLIVNVTDTNAVPEASRASMTETRDSVKVIYKTVDKSLQELTTVKNKLAKYMVEYGIAVLDADEVTNSVDITLCYDHPKTVEELEALAETLIDLQYVNITVLPEGATIEPTGAYE